MKPKKRKVRITKTDELFFKYLFAVKVTTYARAKRDIYKHYSYEGLANRLRKLENIGLLRGGSERLVESGAKCISITKTAFNRYIKSGDEYRVELKSDSVTHDLFLNDFRSSLSETKNLKNFVTENQLQTWGKSSLTPTIQACVTSNSDAFVTLDINGIELDAAVEYEAFQKSDARYQKLIDCYYANNTIQNVLYVAASSSIIKKMMEIEREKIGDDEPKFNYCLSKNALKSETLKFFDLNNGVIRLSTNKVMV